MSLRFCELKEFSCEVICWAENKCGTRSKTYVFTSFTGVYTDISKIEDPYWGGRLLGR